MYKKSTLLIYLFVSDDVKSKNQTILKEIL